MFWSRIFPNFGQHFATAITHLSGNENMGGNTVIAYICHSVTFFVQTEVLAMKKLGPIFKPRKLQRQAEM